MAYTKANHTKMQFGSGGAGSGAHLNCMRVNAAIGVDVTHVYLSRFGPGDAGPVRRPARLLLRARGCCGWPA